MLDQLKSSLGSLYPAKWSFLHAFNNRSDDRVEIIDKHLLKRSQTIKLLTPWLSWVETSSGFDAEQDTMDSFHNLNHNQGANHTKEIQGNQAFLT